MANMLCCICGTTMNTVTAARYSVYWSRWLVSTTPFTRKTAKTAVVLVGKRTVFSLCGRHWANFISKSHKRLGVVVFCRPFRYNARGLRLLGQTPRYRKLWNGSSQYCLALVTAGDFLRWRQYIYIFWML